VGTGLELGLHLGSPASLGAPAFRTVGLLLSAPLADAAIEDHLHGAITGESLAKVLI
jgi:hypothetical protein